MAETGTFPHGADTIVVGGGTAGAAIAARLAAGSDRNVVLLEAGPDYGPRGSGRWPMELLDFTGMPVTSHAWGYLSACGNGTPELPLDRARVIGGCSSHNGCAAVWGHRDDYDGWAALGNPGWDTDSLLPLFATVNTQLRVFTPTPDEITPWHRACLDAAPTAGFPVVPNVNDVDLNLGIAIGPINVAEGVRWNTAFAYLDPVRHLPNLAIRGDTLVDRVIVDRGRATAIEIVGTNGTERIEASEIILCAGAYGSPLILLRSGIGNPEELRPLGLTTIHSLPGVGRNLQDHTASHVAFAGTPELVEAMDVFAAAGIPPREEGTIVVAQSSRCRSAFDLHLYPLGRRLPDGGWHFGIYTAIMTPQSRGTVRLSGRDPEAPPIIDHCYFTDDEDADLEVLADGIDLARQMAAGQPLSRLAGTETWPGPALRDRAALHDHLRTTATHDYHPAGSCKMGPDDDPSAVVDAGGRVHGLEDLYVADASIMPVVPRANTNLPAAVDGEKIAAQFLQTAFKR
ncbi:MAG: choline dehydrogenase [Thermomicrobiales bacterium]|nr:choline dehydrogenase [Thermomicrobiales bacterium]